MLDSDIRIRGKSFLRQVCNMMERDEDLREGLERLTENLK